jgi:hypothetical protein
MNLGIDFDNTIVCYNGVFHKIAVEKDLVPHKLPPSKGHVRDYLRVRGQEETWIELQGYVYGARMLDAVPFPGVLDFFAHCKAAGVSVSIISHRTLFPFAGPQYDMHQAAREWIKHYGFYDQSGLTQAHVFFELTKQDKINRIKSQQCEVFIDDLPEFLTEPSFPEIRRILFDHGQRYASESRFERATNWEEIGQLVLQEEKAI